MEIEITWLRKSCVGYVGRLGRCYKELEVLLADTTNYDLVVKKYEQLKGVFQAYEVKIAEYHEKLSGTEKESAMAQNEVSKKNHAEFIQRITEWMEAAKEMGGKPGKDSVNVADDNISMRSRSSRRSNASTTSSIRLKEARTRKQLAQLKMKQLAQTQILKIQQLELENKLSQVQLDHDIENAEVEERIWEEEVQVGDQASNASEVDGPDKVVGNGNTIGIERSEAIDSKLNPHAPEWGGGWLGPNDNSFDVSRPTDPKLLYHTISMAMNMPKPELVTFNGDPVEFWGFINNFEVNIGSMAIDDRMKLTYLIQYCKGKARESIEDCILLEPRSGYRRAREILREQFGQPHVICHALLNKVLNSQQIKPNDGNALWELARIMRKCQITVTQMGYSANLDNTETLFSIQHILPLYLQSDWARQAQGIISRGVEPRFSHMTEFVDQAARSANSMYGKNVGKGTRAEKPAMKPGTKGKSGGSFQKAYSFTTEGNTGSSYRRELKCPCCKGQHILVGCKEFKDKPQRERLRFVRHNRLCDNCLKPSHIARDCRFRPGCAENGCDRKHHTLLHFTPKSGDHDTFKNGAGVSTEPQGVEVSTSEGINLSIRSSQRVCLRVLPVRVTGNGHETTTWALLDSGSDTSLCELGLAKELALSGHIKEFSLKTITGTKENQGLEVSLHVCNIQGGESINMSRVWTVDKLPVSTESMPRREDVDKWPHLRGIELPVTGARDIKLLIGSDTPEAFWVEEQRRGKGKEPYAVRTPLGWTLLGPISKGNGKGLTFGIHHITTMDDSLQYQLKRFWEVDHAFGKGDETRGDSQDDRKARGIMEASVKHVNGHYEIGMPWRDYPLQLPNNWQMANSRIHGLKRRFNKDEDLYDRYKATIDDYLKKGYAREVNESNDAASEGTVWYLPHHPVIHPLKPGKVRVVFDCAAQFKGVSLNSQLMQGPDYTNRLVGVLTRFRQEKIALMADVEAMFHQVRVSPRDVDALRFLWWQDGDPKKPLKQYQMLVHLFGATSSPSCAGFALRKTAEDNSANFDEGVANTIIDNFYVDDCLKSVGSKNEAKKLIPQLINMLQRGGFRLTKWASNDRDVLSTVPPSERAKSVVDLDLDHLPLERTLGVLWDMDTDEFRFKVMAREVNATRRGILSAISSLYDPLGFVAPFTLRAKIQLQDLCAKGLGWDEPVGSEELFKWKGWLAELPELQSVKIKRYLKSPNSNTFDLHVFGDASERGYAAVAYLRMVDSAGGIDCSFLMGKARLCPLKKTSVPRLELMAAVLAVELSQILKEELRLSTRSVTYWTDSTAVLLYLRNESRRFRTFVANRVAKIQEASNVREWRYVDTLSNPADDGSRGLHAKQTSSECRWLKGPDFLWKGEEHWPVAPSAVSEQSVELEVPDPELRQGQVYLANAKDPITLLMERYSTWRRLRGGVAWMIRYKMYLLSRVKGESCGISESLSATELMEAEIEIVKWVQERAFPDAMNKACKGKGDNNWKSTAFNKLSPMLVNGVLRVGGRLRNAPIEYDQKHPVILPSNHHVTRLIIEHYHTLVGHSGAGMTWASLRNKFWVMKGGAMVRKVIGKCFNCRKRNSPRGEQYMADLPAARVTPDKAPFSFVGVDLFGPLLVKQGRSLVKRYGCIFTCMTVRAIHIELVDSMDTDSFLNALRRFISRRGSPEKIFSDNGTNFKGGERELREALATLDERKVGRHLRQRGIDWEFNPPTASHMGGVWERMIRSIRRILKVLLKGQVVTQDVLTTLLTEVEAILNSRPLTQISFDPKDDVPLTPNHLLLMRESPNNSPGVFDKNDSYGKRRWRQCQYLANEFWKRWLREYLPLLQERQRWFKEKRNFQENDLVLLVDDGIPRGNWSLGKVVQVFPDKMGRVRQVEVRVGPKYFRRPISKLCLLEGEVKSCEVGKV